MIITFHAHGGVGLAHPEDLKRFHLAGVRPRAEDVDELKQRGIELDDDATHAWVDPAVLLEMAQGHQDLPEVWSTDFEGMVAYATSKGWTDARGWLRGHTEWTS